jgi:hypothetical protein
MVWPGRTKTDLKSVEIWTNAEINGKYREVK